ncbi:MAG: response regulator [Sulfitobacter sp.]
MNPINTLVIAEDDPLIALDIQLCCEEAGLTVLAIAGSVAQAKRKFSEHCPDAIVSDMELGPDGDGCDIVEEIRKRCPDIRVIFLTGTTDPIKLKRIADAMPEIILTKPVQPRKLEEALQLIG